MTKPAKCQWVVVPCVLFFLGQESVYLPNETYGSGDLSMISKIITVYSEMSATSLFSCRIKYWLTVIIDLF